MSTEFICSASIAGLILFIVIFFGTKLSRAMNSSPHVFQQNGSWEDSQAAMMTERERMYSDPPRQNTSPQVGSHDNSYPGRVRETRRNEDDSSFRLPTNEEIMQRNHGQSEQSSESPKKGEKRFIPESEMKIPFELTSKLKDEKEAKKKTWADHFHDRDY